MKQTKRTKKGFSTTRKYKKTLKATMIALLFTVMIMLNIAVALAQVQSHNLSEIRRIDTDLDMKNYNIKGANQINGTTVHAVGGLAEGELGANNMGVYGRYGSVSGFIAGTKNFATSAVYGEYNSDILGRLGTSNMGAYGQYNSTRYGYLGGQDAAVFGIEANTYKGYLGKPGSGVYGETGTSVYGYLGGMDTGAYGYYWGSYGSLGTNGIGVYGNGTRYGIYGATSGTNTLAGYFKGNVNVSGNMTVGTGTIFIDGSNNRVGIGTENPTNDIEVYKTTGDPILLLRSIATDSKPAVTLVNDMRSWSIKMDGADEDKLKIIGSSGTFLTINNSGFVGIGTENPDQALKVVGNVNVTKTLYASNVSSNSPLQLQTKGVTRMYINDTTGNVGIGTTSPQSTLSVGGEGDPSYAIYGNGSLKGILGEGTNWGVYGLDSDDGSFGIIGYGKYGVYGTGSGANSEGVHGEGATYGVYGKDSDGTGLGALGNGNTGVYGYGSSYGLYANGGTYGVYGEGSDYGVMGKDSDNSGYGYLGYGDIGVYGIGSTWAGRFDGKAYVTDYLEADGGIHVGGSSDPGTDNLIVDGKVGIGTTSPAYTLDVNGNARVGWNGDSKYIKLLPADFETDHNYGNAKIQNYGGSVAMGYSPYDAWVQVSIPMGYMATGAMIYSNVNAKIVVFDCSIKTSSCTQVDPGCKANGFCAFSKLVNSDEINYLSVMYDGAASTDEIYGGFIEIKQM